MSIAPLAALGIAKTAFSILDAFTKSDSDRKLSQSSLSSVAQESIWHKLGQQNNVRAMSKDALSQLSTDLYSEDAITMEDHIALTSDSSSLLTGTNAKGEVDWVAEYQARLANHQAAGNEAAVQQDQSILNILGRLQAGSRGVTSIMV